MFSHVRNDGNDESFHTAWDVGFGADERANVG